MTDAPLALGPMILARSTGEHRAGARCPASAEAEFLTFYFPHRRDAARGGEVQVVDGVGPPVGLDAQGYLALLVPRRFLAGTLRESAIPKRVDLCVAMRMLQGYLVGLLLLERGRLCDRQAELAASAVRSLLAAALLAAAAESGLGVRRQVALLDRIVAHIDANLHAPMWAETLCADLGCSRSALYRATAAAGGAAELIVTRRLHAIGGLMRDPDEIRSIAAIAQTHGFGDTTQFNRRFKALFGAPPGEVRRRAGGGEGGGPRRGNPVPRPMARATDPGRPCN